MSAQSDSGTWSNERQEMRRLVREHQGNRTAIARALSERGQKITRQGVSSKLRRLGLLEEADKLSQAASKPGPRDNVPPAILEREREALLDALARSETYADAPAKLGISIATMYRRIASHGIKQRHVVKRRRQLGLC